MSIAAQFDLGGGWDTAWLHELRGLDGKWIRGDELQEAAQLVKPSAVNEGDAIVAWGSGGMKPMSVDEVRDLGGANHNREIVVRDPDTGETKTLTLGDGDEVRMVGYRDKGGKMKAFKPPPPKTDELHKSFDQARRQLDADFASGVRSESKPGAPSGLNQGKHTPGNDYFGNTADTTVVTFNNGHKWVRKRDLKQHEMSNEVLASKLGRAVGAGAPLALVHDDVKNPDEPPNWPPEKDVLWMQYVSGAKPAIEWLGGVDDKGNTLGKNDPYDMMETPEGRRIGVLDNLSGNADRHYGNWMVATDKSGREYPVPIDHGQANDYSGLSLLAGGAGPFGQNLLGFGADNPLAKIPDGELAQMQRNIGLLKSDYQSDGRGYDYENLVKTMTQLRRQAGHARTAAKKAGAAA